MKTALKQRESIPIRFMIDGYNRSDKSDESIMEGAMLGDLEEYREWDSDLSEYIYSLGKEMRIGIISYDQGEVYDCYLLLELEADPVNMRVVVSESNPTYSSGEAVNKQPTPYAVSGTFTELIKLNTRGLSDKFTLNLLFDDTPNGMLKRLNINGTVA